MYLTICLSSTFIVHGNPFSTNEGIGDYAYNIGKLMVQLFWVLLDPGEKPVFPHDSLREKFADVILIIYHIFAILILLNLTITLMNSTIQKFQDRQQLYWKCEMTTVWIEFFDSPSKLSLPMPFSIILVFWTVVCIPVLKFWRFCCQSEKTTTQPMKSDHLSPNQINARRKHAKLMQELIMRLIKKSKIHPKANKLNRKRNLKSNESKH